MVDGFYESLEKAKPAERMTLLVLQEAFGDTFKLEDVSDDKDCYTKGDIKVTDDKGKIHYIDVKDDGVIHRTGNVFGEEHVFYKRENTMGTGFMLHATYNLVAVMSKQLQRIWLIDFKKWQQVYNDKAYGFEKTMYHKSQNSYGYLNPVQKLIDSGICTHTVDFGFSGSFEHPKSVWIEGITKHMKAEKKAA